MCVVVNQLIYTEQKRRWNSSNQHWFQPHAHGNRYCMHACASLLKQLTYIYMQTHELNVYSYLCMTMLLGTGSCLSQSQLLYL